ncbi:bcl-2-binding component 3 isoform X2 [Larus michahellis]|uniref:bcl-2-binding component 3 isoform X2 n=1 Tax=Larus michahellis TaxID=119627 RepID=UPI003D9B0D47
MASEGSLAEPPAPPPAPPACRRGGGPLGLRVPLAPPRRHPRLSCACPGGGCPGLPPPPHPARAIGLCRCGTPGPPPATHGEFHPMENGPPHEGPPQSGGGSRGGAVPNGHLPGDPPGPERELGARLRRLGDAFQQTYEQQQRGGVGGVFWGHLYRLVSQLLGAVYNLQGREGN